MIIKMFCSTNNFLSLEKDLNFLSFLFTSNNQLLKEEILDENFKKVIGRIATDHYKDSPYFFLQKDYTTQTANNLSEEDNKILNDNSTIYSIIFETFVSFLWLIKDNCCSLNSFHTYAPGGNKVIVKPNALIYFTSKGIQNEKMFFSDDEMHRAIELFVKGYSLFYHKNVRVSKPGDILPGAIIKRDITPYDFKKINRIERAFHFLGLARTTPQLPLKISFYMCIYETLFYGANTGEITHQIAERVALYAVNTRFMRHGIYKQIKEAYKVRSIYFHGNSFKSYRRDLSEISYYLDNLTRQILLKIILKDSGIFLQEDELLEQSFYDLLFEDERKPHGMTYETGLKHLRFKD
jgi:Apea-like HEPN